jgi:hypothetical protein
MADDQVISNILGVEGTGKNPLSSAQGPGQFIDSTWVDIVKRIRPDLTAGHSNQEILGWRTRPPAADPTLPQDMTAQYAQENQAALASKGLPVTPGTTYLSHFLGPGGAQKILTADPGADAAGILGNTVISANPFLRGMNAGQVAQWAEGKMQGAPLPSQTIGSAPSIAQPQTAPQLPALGAPQQPQQQLAGGFAGSGVGAPAQQQTQMPPAQMQQLQNILPQIQMAMAQRPQVNMQPLQNYLQGLPGPLGLPAQFKSLY